MVGHHQQPDFILAEIPEPADDFRIDFLDSLDFFIWAGAADILRSAGYGIWLPWFL